MCSLRISNCLNNYATFPIRSTTYINLYHFPESTMDLANQMGGGGGGGASKNHSGRDVLVKSVSCRQLYLRSYSTLARKEYLAPQVEQNNKYFHQGREISLVMSGGRRRRRRKMTTTKLGGAGRNRRWRHVVVVRRVKEFSCTMLRAFLHKLLSCAVSVDVVDHKGKL